MNQEKIAPVKLIDLGFAVGKLEVNDGDVSLLILIPVDGDGIPAASTVVNGWEYIRELGETLCEYYSLFGPKDVGEFDTDLLPDD